MKAKAVSKHADSALALSLGMALYFLLDSFIDSTELGVTRGFSEGLQPLVLLASFALPFLILVLARTKPDLSWPLWVVAVGISIHSFSEANGLATAAPLYVSNFATVLPDAVSFVLHKFLEGFIFAVAASLAAVSLKRALAMASPVVVLGVAGAASSALSLDLTPFVAAGAGGWLAVTMSLAPRFSQSSRFYLFLMLLLGFVIVYSASLLHFTSNALG